MEQTEDKDGVMRRIEKLLAIAQDHRADPNEAAAAARMAERIMRKYEIEHADVVMRSIKNQEDMDQKTVLATALRKHEVVRNVAPWVQWIAVCIGKLMDCKVDTCYERPHQVIRFSGFASDVKIAAWQLDYLCTTVNMLCEAFRKTDTYIQAESQRVMNSYRSGVAMGICSLLSEAKKSKDSDNVQESGQSTGALIVLAKTKAVEEKFGVIKYKKSETVTAQGNSFKQGHKDGRNVDVNRRAVGTNSSNTKLIGG